MVDPIQNYGNVVVGYPVDCLEYHFGESTVTAVRFGLAIVETAECFGSNFRRTDQMVPARVEHCFLFAKRMLEKDRCQLESPLVPRLGRYRLWNVLKVTAQSQLDAEVRHLSRCLRIV